MNVTSKSPPWLSRCQLAAAVLGTQGVLTKGVFKCCQLVVNIPTGSLLSKSKQVQTNPKQTWKNWKDGMCWMWLVVFSHLPRFPVSTGPFRKQHIINTWRKRTLVMDHPENHTTYTTFDQKNQKKHIKSYKIIYLKSPYFLPSFFDTPWFRPTKKKAPPHGLMGPMIDFDPSNRTIG